MNQIPPTLDALRVPIEGLVPYDKNPRRGNVELIAESLERHGQYRPIVVRVESNEILAGNHTVRAAQELGWSEIAATFVDVDDDTAARIVLIDNRSDDVAVYDNEALADLLGALPDLDGTGYEPDDLEELARSLTDDAPVEGRTDPDQVPDEPDEPTCNTGDVWQLGEHRLVVGDAADPDVWVVTLGGQHADLLWTDPPYGVAYQADLTPEQARRLRRRTDGLEVANDKLTGEKLVVLLQEVFTLGLEHVRPGACWYVTAPPGPTFADFATVLGDLGIWRQTLMWVKDQFVFGRSDYHYRHEPIFYGWTPGGAHHAPPDRTQDTVHEIARPSVSKHHPTVKPTELVEKHLLNSTRPDELVIDPFAGSGTTLIAAHRQHRLARLIELDPRYADVICRRYQEFTGNKPTRDGTPHDFTGEGVGS